VPEGARVIVVISGPKLLVSSVSSEQNGASLSVPRLLYEM
jgi:hypothetical protein